ncbi:MAG: exodeoxyribonuclease VII large subunit [Spirochaetales bacterium]|nr:exodeoxyribonuclease VII large subunit [Spirochaetales bacterium]MBR6062196.1 exodeoxyribonuclease VII large subunit [Spirochaetales bacterium]MBR6199359.1 exodeoxyribonuclease VII large subunit [Spirochaetales bacterium]
MQDNSKYSSVTEISNIIKAGVEGMIERVYIRGEITGFKISSTGHLFFSLKDSVSSISVCIWKSQWPRVLASVSGNLEAFQNGVEVLAEGTLSVYTKNTTVSVVISKMTPAGVGEQALKFEMLKQKLAAEGLFDPSRKKPLPDYPKRIGIVSAITAAGKGDMLKILAARSPFIEIVVFPTPVQGEAAAAGIIKAIDCASKHYINDTKYKVDVLIIGRGGGAIEDMWCFNDESVARAIAACPIPTITGIGHEQDTTIADFVSDVRASTPSNAAEIVTRNTVGIYDSVSACRVRLQGKMRSILENVEYRLERCASQRLVGLMNTRYSGRMSDFNFTQQRFSVLMNKSLEDRRNRFAMLVQKLDNMSPLKILSRGYAIVQDGHGQTVTDAEQVHAGEQVDIVLHKGRVKAVVDCNS